MQKATPRTAQDGRSSAKPTQETAPKRQPKDALAARYDEREADLLTMWRVGLQGDRRTCDTMLLYRQLIPDLGPRGALAEVGVAWGRGAIYAASVFVGLGWKEGRVYAVDSWRGPGDPDLGHSAMHFSAALASIALNVLPYEADIIYPIRMASPAAAGCFGAGELDLVLIDGCHTYEAVMADIAGWTRTIRAGGVLAGHDYTDDFPGVRRAVEEAFGPRVSVRGSCWAVAM